MPGCAAALGPGCGLLDVHSFAGVLVGRSIQQDRAFLSHETALSSQAGVMRW